MAHGRASTSTSIRARQGSAVRLSTLASSVGMAGNGRRQVALLSTHLRPRASGSTCAGQVIMLALILLTRQTLSLRTLTAGTSIGSAGNREWSVSAVLTN